jgi:hypothetical protein
MFPRLFAYFQPVELTAVFSHFHNRYHESNIGLIGRVDASGHKGRGSPAASRRIHERLESHLPLPVQSLILSTSVEYFNCWNLSNLSILRSQSAVCHCMAAISSSTCRHRISEPAASLDGLASKRVSGSDVFDISFRTGSLVLCTRRGFNLRMTTTKRAQRNRAATAMRPPIIRIEPATITAVFSTSFIVRTGYRTPARILLLLKAHAKSLSKTPSLLSEKDEASGEMVGSWTGLRSCARRVLVSAGRRDQSSLPCLKMAREYAFGEVIRDSVANQISGPRRP